MVDEEQWNIMRDKVKANIKSKLPVIAIGSGGNINKVFSLSKRKDGKPLTLELLKDYYKELSSFTLEERIRIYKLKDDRADVIVPALRYLCKYYALGRNRRNLCSENWFGRWADTKFV